jgi:hypothetical protein
MVSRSPRPDASGIGAMQFICIARLSYRVRLFGHGRGRGGGFAHRYLSLCICRPTARNGPGVHPLHQLKLLVTLIYVLPVPSALPLQKFPVLTESHANADDSCYLCRTFCDVGTRDSVSRVVCRAAWRKKPSLASLKSFCCPDQSVFGKNQKVLLSVRPLGCQL